VFPGEKGNKAAGELGKPRRDVVADRKVRFAMGHHAKSLGAIDEHDVVGNVRARLRRRGAAHQRGRVDRAVTAGALFDRIGRAATDTEAAVKILQAAAGRAALIDDRFGARGPVGQMLLVAAHRTRSRNMLTCDESTPPSPCSSAIEASRTWRFPARPVICKWVSARCAIAPPTPQWP